MILEPCECGAPAKLLITRVCCSRPGCDFELSGLRVSTWNRVMMALALAKHFQPCPCTPPAALGPGDAPYPPGTVPGVRPGPL